jgi:hypothetical protein
MLAGRNRAERAFSARPSSRKNAPDLIRRAHDARKSQSRLRRRKPEPRQLPVPSPDSDTAARASTQNVLRRAQMPQPEYRRLASWLVARGFAGRSAGARGALALARDNRETRLVHRRIRCAGQTGPAIVLMLVALLTLDNR